MRQALALAAFVLALAAPAGAADVAHGRLLFQESCSSCHGLNGEGVTRQGPSLRGVGAAAADFYLSTGRMPLDDPGRQPDRTRPAFSGNDLRDLVAFVASLGGGPPIPHADPRAGSPSEGQHLFATSCGPCHQVVARSGVVNGAFAPSLRAPTSTQIAEAVRVGPYVMPAFDERQISQHQLDSLARYVQWTKHPENRGGWGLFEIGPVPEGMVTWFLAAVVLLVFVRLLGERHEE